MGKRGGLLVALVIGALGVAVYLLLFTTSPGAPPGADGQNVLEGKGTTTIVLEDGTRVPGAEWGYDTRP